MKKLNYKLINSDIVHNGVVFDLQVDHIEYESGNTAIREVALHNGGAVVVPVVKDGKIILVNQFRYPFKKFLLELPAGKLDPDEDPLVCASRELTEETGYSTENFIKLGVICTTPGFCTEILHIYLATDLRHGDHSREEGEFGMEVHEYDLNQIGEMMLKGEIIDSKTISGLHLYKEYLKSNGR